MERKTFIIINGRCSGKTRIADNDHIVVNSEGFIINKPYEDISPTDKHLTKSRKKNKRKRKWVR